MRGAKRREIAEIMGVTERTIGNYFVWLKMDSHQKTPLLAYIYYYNLELMVQFQEAIGKEKEFYNVSFGKLIDGRTKRSKKLL
jgi:hypothetical protein